MELPPNASKEELKKLQKKFDEDLVESKTVLGRFFLSFAATRNLDKLINGRGESDPNLKVLHGIRFLTMNWMIMGHVYAFTTLVPQTSFVYIQDVLKNSYWMEKPI